MMNPALRYERVGNLPADFVLKLSWIRFLIRPLAAGGFGRRTFPSGRVRDCRGSIAIRGNGSRILFGGRTETRIGFGAVWPNSLTGQAEGLPITAMQTAKSVIPRNVQRTRRATNPARKDGNPRKDLWVAVKVERGSISESKVFESEQAAQQAERKWRARLNPDYDEAAGLKSRLIPCHD